MAENPPPTPPEDTGTPASMSPPGPPPPPPPPPAASQPPASEASVSVPPPPPSGLPGPVSVPPLRAPRPSLPPRPATAPSGIPDLRAPAPFATPRAAPRIAPSNGAPGIAPSAGELTKAPLRRRRWLIPLVAGLIVLIAGGGAIGVLLTRANATRSTPGAKTVAYTDPDGYYTAQFDSEPGYHATTQTTPIGSVPYRYAEYVDSGVDQLVGVLVFTPGASFDTAKGLQGMASAGNGSVVSSQVSTFQGYPSTEGVINLTGTYLKVQIVHVGNVAYIIGTAGPVNPPTDYARFIASVHITPH
ncbi:MAG: hypothetical protein JOZ75_12620 [Candidatus Dormibacteraeota bacterium]|nr:hypothetical protein [Candidatus Dormibacteraeota bacterium]